jgi:mRNA degradation ribonuclease J1/J2
MVSGRVTFSDIKNVIKATVTKYLARKTQRYPMIIPVIINKN